MRPYNPNKLVWALPISLAATFGISGGSLPFLISVPGLLRWFSSPSVASVPYFIQVSDNGIAPVGLPHSAIQGSQDMCSFPWLIAAYHGLLRLVAPRHPPYTSIRLTILSFFLIKLLQIPTGGSSMPSRQVSHGSSGPSPFAFAKVQGPRFTRTSSHGSFLPLLRSLPLFCQISLALSGFPYGLPFRTFFRACLAPS